MKILSAQQVRAADKFTIENSRISSVDLMERAGRECFEWIRKNISGNKFLIFCGRGNNGGDGLVIARLLAENKKTVSVCILDGNRQSDEFKHELNLIDRKKIQIREISTADEVTIGDNDVIIDAVFGTGLSREVDASVAEIFNLINSSGKKIISIDIPSGVFADKHTPSATIHADHALTFETPKTAFFFPENAEAVGEFHVINIMLDKNFIESVSAPQWMTHELIRDIIRPRKKFSHKGDFGKALLIAGSKGKAGAAVMASRACLRTGAGLLTVHVPAKAADIIHMHVPEAMVEHDQHEEIISSISDAEKFDATGVGPGIGKDPATAEMLFTLLRKSTKPVVIDADALNILSDHPYELKSVPENSILTPHIKEFERLAGTATDDFDRHERQKKFSEVHKVIVVLKGHYTCITAPDGSVFFNSTGNAGMAKGGTGDALTGMIVGLLSQKYAPLDCAVAGVYLHGLAGDIAAQSKGQYSMLCSDLIECIPDAFRKIIQSTE